MLFSIWKNGYLGVNCSPEFLICKSWVRKFLMLNFTEIDMLSFIKALLQPSTSKFHHSLHVIVFCVPLLFPWKVPGNMGLSCMLIFPAIWVLWQEFRPLTTDAASGQNPWQPVQSVNCHNVRIFKMFTLHCGRIDLFDQTLCRTRRYFFIWFMNLKWSVKSS